MTPTSTHPLSEKPRIVVVGAGYAGMMSALRLAPHAHVTLVDPADRFTERVRLHERAAGRPDVTHPLGSFLHPTGIVHVAARATAIDTAVRESVPTTAESCRTTGSSTPSAAAPGPSARATGTARTRSSRPPNCTSA